MSENNTISCNFAAGIMLWRYPADSFRAASSLLVKDGQWALLTINGKVYDILMPGIYIANAEVLPATYKKRGYPADYAGMIDANLWFVSMETSADQNWQIRPGETTLIDHAEGSLRLSIADPAVFFASAQPTGSSYSSEALFNLILGDFRNYLPKVIIERMVKDKASPLSLTPPFDALEGFFMNYFNEHIMPQCGYTLRAFTITNLSFSKPEPATKAVTGKPATPERSAPKMSINALTGIGCLGLLIVAFVISIIYFNNRNKAYRAKQAIWVEKIKGWTYSERKNEDSVVTDQNAYLYSDQYIEGKAEGKNYGELEVEGELQLYKNCIHDIDSSLTLYVPNKYGVPFAFKRSKYITVRFDSDTAIQVNIDKIWNEGQFSLNPSTITIPRLRRSHTLTVLLASAANSDSIVQYTFHTEGLKW